MALFRSRKVTSTFQSKNNFGLYPAFFQSKNYFADKKRSLYLLRKEPRFRMSPAIFQSIFFHHFVKPGMQASRVSILSIRWRKSKGIVYMTKSCSWSWFEAKFMSYLYAWLWMSLILRLWISWWIFFSWNYPKILGFTDFWKSRFLKKVTKVAYFLWSIKMISTYQIHKSAYGTPRSWWPNKPGQVIAMINGNRSKYEKILAIVIFWG